MIDVYLLLGSNIGNRNMFLQLAIEGITAAVGQVFIQSDVYETPAWGKTDEPDYLNQVLLVKTELTAQTVLETILGIEKELGRERIEKWGSRTIDIDILFYGDQIINSTHLTVPHPHLHNRKFALLPMAQIAADFVHPVINETVTELLFRLNTQL